MFVGKLDYRRECKRESGTLEIRPRQENGRKTGEPVNAGLIRHLYCNLNVIDHAVFGANTLELQRLNTAQPQYSSARY